jgi:hypothetical protein
MDSHTGPVRKVADTDDVRCQEHGTDACVGRTANGHQSAGVGEHDGIIDMSHCEALGATPGVKEKRGKQVTNHVFQK